MKHYGNMSGEGIFCLLMETAIVKELQFCLKEKYEWGGDILFAHGDSNSKGVAILFKRNLNYQLGKLILDPCNRFILTEIDFDKKKIILGNVYVSNKDDTVFYGIFCDLAQFPKANIILGGD